VEIRNIMKSFVEKVRVKHSILLTVSILLTAFFYIWAPFEESKIKLSSQVNFFDIQIPKEFESFTLTFDDDVYISKYSMHFFSSIQGKQVIRTINQKDVEQKLKELKVINLLSQTIFLDEQKSDSLRIKVLHNMNTPVLIVSVKIDNQKVDIKNFYNNILYSKNKTLIKYQYIREDISRFLLKFNDPISNIILTILFIYLFPLLYELFIKSWYCLSIKKFESKLQKKYTLTSKKHIEIAEISIAEKYYDNDNWFRFLQIFGPAIGFALTISSLIVGLNPSIQTTQNISMFFETIQIAMVSTFLGLSIRIVALLLQKCNNKLLIQADEFFFTVKVHLKSKKSD
jgi:hypothetical protein